MVIFLQIFALICIAEKAVISPHGVSRIVRGEVEARRSLFFVDDMIAANNEFWGDTNAAVADTWERTEDAVEDVHKLATKVVEEGIEILESIDIDDIVGLIEDLWDQLTCGSQDNCLSGFEINGCLPGDSTCVIDYEGACLGINKEVGREASTSKSIATSHGGMFTASAGVTLYGSGKARFNAGLGLKLTLTSNPKIRITLREPTVTVNAEAKFELEANMELNARKKKIHIGQEQVMLTKAFMAGPIPVLIEVTGQPVAFLTAKGSVDATGTVTYAVTGTLSLPDIWFELSLANMNFIHNFDTVTVPLPELEDSFSFEFDGQVNINIEAQVGMDLSLKVYKAVEFKLQPRVTSTLDVTGYVTASVGGNSQSGVTSASFEAGIQSTMCVGSELGNSFGLATGRRSLASFNFLDAMEETCDSVLNTIFSDCWASAVNDLVDVCGVTKSLLQELGFPSSINVPDLGVDLPVLEAPESCVDYSASHGVALTYEQAVKEGASARTSGASGTLIKERADCRDALQSLPESGSTNSLYECEQLCLNTLECNMYAWAVHNSWTQCALYAETECPTLSTSGGSARYNIYSLRRTVVTSTLIQERADCRHALQSLPESGSTSSLTECQELCLNTVECNMYAWAVHNSWTQCALYSESECPYLSTFGGSTRYNIYSLRRTNFASSLIRERADCRHSNLQRLPESKERRSLSACEQLCANTFECNMFVYATHNKWTGCVLYSETECPTITTSGASSRYDIYRLQRTVESELPKHYTMCGRPGSCDDVESPKLTDDTKAKAVRCVSESSRSNWRSNCGIWYESDVWSEGCQILDYDSAVAFCESKNARLPTLMEVEAGCVAGSGCLYDDEYIWTSSSKKEFTNVGEGVCMDAEDSYFNDLQNYSQDIESCQYSFDECKDYCKQMGKSCVGIVHDNMSCSLQLRNGVSKSEAQALVPDFCASTVFSNSDNTSTGGIVRASGHDGYICWAHLTVSEHYTMCGRPDSSRCDDTGVKRTDDTKAMAVRCVSDSSRSNWRSNCGIWYESDVWSEGCQTLDYDSAVAFCEGKNARLPTLMEVQAGCVAGSGCHYDDEHIWTSSFKSVN